MPPESDRVFDVRFAARSSARRISTRRSSRSRIPKYPAWIRSASSTVKKGSKLISCGTSPTAQRVKR